MPLGDARKSRDLALIARGCDNQRAILNDARHGLTPRVQTLAPEIAHNGGRRFRLAFRRKHRPRPTASTQLKRLRARLNHAHGVTRLRQPQRLPQAEHASPNNGV